MFIIIFLRENFLVKYIFCITEIIGYNSNIRHLATFVLVALLIIFHA
jgi:hypothetical protein